MATDGRYPKGVLKREQILDTALEVFADEGYRGTSLRTVAARCDLSVAGVLHYFDSREDLLAQVIARRDQIPRPAGTASVEPFALADGIRANIDQPGLVELFVSLTAAARDHTHPAHEVLARHYTSMRLRIQGAMRDLQDAGQIPAHLDPDALARLIIAAADGAQLQWMVDDEASLDGPLATLIYGVLGLTRLE
ncbi:transcriptional regulator, TetR family [Sanguibacter gelidistatuariae]|uniref:Transcriptional regulator, TetR family n=1 Tax=Sanguibacter gelidistatuariae TaxID=1814289 RepID=A0A1G6GPN8_9MICO|nr:TetR/AcrR family transcriptional regulator [Sanguibacter gelidistatuariae]SDB83901.1 transcriptional regulator, TetR family [Sanguibacter gelidistatuariae]